MSLGPKSTYLEDCKSMLVDATPTNIAFFGRRTVILTSALEIANIKDTRVMQ